MRALIIGTGAAGNKAAINLLETGVTTEEDMLLINSTLKDIPEKYRSKAVQLSRDIKGCGKERGIAKEITEKAIKDGDLEMLDFIKNEHGKVIIITSIEGGTGSGSTTVLADYCYNKCEMEVEIYAFKGFEEDVRGLANTIEFFQELQPYYTTQVIRNEAFLKEVSGDIKKAQKLANEELAKRIKVSLGQIIEDCEDNIDDSDLFKSTFTTGFSTIEYTTIDDNIKSKEEYNTIIAQMLNSSKSILTLDMKTSQVCAIIMNLNENSQGNIDYTFKPLREKIGEGYEIFKHIQDSKNMEQFIAVIISGMKLPEVEIKEIYKRYQERSKAIDKSRDDGYKNIRTLVGNKEDSRYDMMRSRRRSRQQQSPTNFSNTKIDVESEY